ncbi:MAG: hypothetical protein P9L97_02440 [Candidatus Tenebribacter davisii]|nr:hypothetical protein [Candidatus Tenebribacter davisii]
MRKFIFVIPLLIIISCSKNPSTFMYNVIYQDTQIVLNWSTCMDKDFYMYKLYCSDNESMNTKKLLFESNNRIDTTYTETIDGPLTYYQVQTTNLSKERSLSNTVFKAFLFQIFGGEGDDRGYSIQQTRDGGYVFVGKTSSFGHGFNDVWLIKTDINGNEEWSQTFGGGYEDEGYSVQQTADGGYIITGNGYTVGNNKPDLWLIKTDNNGNEEWSQKFGGADVEQGRSVQQTSDRGYIIVGFARTKSDNHFNIWLVKTDSNGNKEWDKTFGKSGHDYGYSVKQTIDGGYIISGETDSAGSSSNNVWLIKTDSNGNKEWDKTFSSGSGQSVQQTSDGGYIIASDGEEWLIKTDSFGNEEWNQSTGRYHGFSVQQTKDDGYIVSGFIPINYSSDICLVKTDTNGYEEWNKTFGGNADDYGYSVDQTADKGYVLIGHSLSFKYNNYNILVIKTDSNGNFNIAYDD